MREVLGQECLWYLGTSGCFFFEDKEFTRRLCVFFVGIWLRILEINGEKFEGVRDTPTSLF